MHLKSITLQGFKSFADRVRLDFTPGVSVIVGPNGSGKSNITDAVLWALGEQSPLAIRGQSMQDVIFAGAHGVKARNHASVEVVLDNSDAGVDIPLTEIAVMRYLDRDGDSGYRINGARCRLTDVIELLSDTGLGREMHSVISQGRVEAIVTSKPRDRRLLIEEAAGLGKHRKRRRRAQLKLERTQDNIDRVLDIEREARTRLRPLKRQAEAAELHERLQRQIDEARLSLVSDIVRNSRAALSAAESAVASARGACSQVEEQLAAVREKREEAEVALSRRSAEREQLSERYHAVRSAHDRVEMRSDYVRDVSARLKSRIERTRETLETLTRRIEEDAGDAEAVARIEQLQHELERLELDHKQELEREIRGLDERHRAAVEQAEALTVRSTELQAQRQTAQAAVDAARQQLRDAQAAAEKARRESATLGAELAALNHFLRSNAGAPGGARALADVLDAATGYELALAAALGSSLRAGVAANLSEAHKLVDGAGSDGGVALVLPLARSQGNQALEAHGGGSEAQHDYKPPKEGAERLLDYTEVTGGDGVLALAQSRLANVWVVDSLDDIDADFMGTVVTRCGRVWSPAIQELRRVPPGATDRVLSERNRRAKLLEQVELAAQSEHNALAAVETAANALTAAVNDHDEAERLSRDAVRTLNDATEAVEHLVRMIERRRNAPAEGPMGERRAQLVGALEAERQLLKRAESERARRLQELSDQKGALQFQCELEPLVERLMGGLRAAQQSLTRRIEVVAAELAHDHQAGEQLAATLRTYAAKEAETQAKIKELSETVTRLEVEAQRKRDQSSHAEVERGELLTKLGLDEGEDAVVEPLGEEEKTDLETRIERLNRRREQLGPVNPLAQEEYNEAREHVEQLERQREDLETALRELKTLIRDTDKQIQTAFETTFAAAAKNFEEMVPNLFPGGRGRLVLVREQPEADSSSDEGGQPQASGETTNDDGATDSDGAATEVSASEHDPVDDSVGVEIELTPAGKTKRRLTLLSGGEKSMTALAFLFAVFLARPCPFYVLDEVEAALDDLNIGRFLKLLRQFADRAQFIVVTHQKRTMEAGDCLYGVSMAANGVSKVVSRKMEKEKEEPADTPEPVELAAAS